MPSLCAMVKECDIFSFELHSNRESTFFLLNPFSEGRQYILDIVASPAGNVYNPLKHLNTHAAVGRHCSHTSRARIFFQGGIINFVTRLFVTCAGGLCFRFCMTEWADLTKSCNNNLFNCQIFVSSWMQGTVQNWVSQTENMFSRHMWTAKV